MDSIVTQIHALVQSTDEEGRREIQRAVRQLQLDLRGPQEVLFDMGNSVGGGFSTLIIWSH